MWNMNTSKRFFLQDIEMKALHNQINPHFLFNTLDMISWKLCMNDTENASRIIQNLSHMLRETVGCGNSYLCTIEHELFLLKCYTDIMQEKYGEALEFIYNVDDNVLGYMIPQFTLQPFVENSIKYGIIENAADSYIIISIYTKSDVLAMRIQDNGCGMDAAKLERILSLIKRMSRQQQGDCSGGGHRHPKYCQAPAPVVSWAQYAAH